MGTYTTNKNLFMPTVGETGWGELVNGNFTTIDTFLKPISLSESTYTFTGNLVGNHVGNQSGGSISATTGAFSGVVTGASFNGVPIKTIVTVTPTNASTLFGHNGFTTMDILQPILGVVYNGKVRVRNKRSSSTITIDYTINGYTYTTQTIDAQKTYDISFSNATCLRVYSSGGWMAVDGITLT